MRVATVSSCFIKKSLRISIDRIVNGHVHMALCSGMLIVIAPLLHREALETAVAIKVPTA